MCHTLCHTNQTVPIHAKQSLYPCQTANPCQTVPIHAIFKFWYHTPYCAKQCDTRPRYPTEKSRLRSHVKILPEILLQGW